jgi:uroporphyrinogen III methyltransferase / synthase
MTIRASAISSEKPLAGRRIVVTRARKQAGGLAQRIEALGGEVIEFPTIEILAPASFADLDRALRQIDNYHWIIFTSVNSVEPFLERLNLAGKTVRDLGHAQVAAIGAETAKRLAAAAVMVAVIPSRFQAEGILESLDPSALAGKRVLIPRAAKARDVLPETLRQWGATVEVVEAYRTVAPVFDATAICRRLQQGDVDMITFTSSSTVSNFVQLCGGDSLTALAGAAAVASIGPITAKTIEELGGRVAVMAQEFTIEGLIAAMIDYFSGSRT